MFAAPPAVGPSRNELSRSLPVAVAKGSKREPFTEFSSDAASRCIPRSSVVSVSHGRHSAPALTPPAVNDALIDFLRQGLTAGPAPRRRVISQEESDLRELSAPQEAAHIIRR